MKNYQGLAPFFANSKETHNVILNDTNAFLKIINNFQNVKFSINKKLLDFIKVNFEALLSSKLIPDFCYLNDSGFILRIRELKKKKDFKLNYFIHKMKESSRFYNVILIAEFLSHFDCFYFVKFIDFRGRLYTRGSIFSPQASDLEKSLLKFMDSSNLRSEIELNA